MATRNPADTSQVNYKGCDWYEPWYGKTAQSVGGVPSKPLNSGQIYGHDYWDGTQVVVVNPIQVNYPA
ncbi:hypothetical protein AB0K16_21935 [Nonomuraea jabiensis]|uniref:hypothetical protein n=1 Tax=Nonomuraea jabiensis TaxID=882448 RepID=UPI00341DCA70